jgi:hypothetical protein
LHLAAGAAALPSLPRRAAAQDAYPSRPIHVVIGFTPGSAADVVARVLSQAAAPLLGQQLVVENKPGAGSSIAAEYVAHAPNDGYTVFLATLSIVTNQIINPNTALDLARDFEPVALLQNAAIILVVNPASDIHSVKELIAASPCKALSGQDGQAQNRSNAPAKSGLSVRLARRRVPSVSRPAGNAPASSAVAWPGLLFTKDEARRIAANVAKLPDHGGGKRRGPLLAQSGHYDGADQCPLLGVKRRCRRPRGRRPAGASFFVALRNLNQSRGSR